MLHYSSMCCAIAAIAGITHVAETLTYKISECQTIVKPFSYPTLHMSFDKY